MSNQIIRFFDKNVFNRIFSGILFVIPFICLIIIGNYFFIIYFLLVLSILIDEFTSATINKINLFKQFLVSTVLIISVFHFIFLRISFDANVIFYLLYIVITIWIFDSFSLIGGKLIGGKKILPIISPNKTYSGLITGFIFLLISSMIIIFYFEYNNYHIIIASIIIGILSFLGDAIESYLKRILLIKDFGNLLPGHGGLLDRMDAFILVFFMHFLLSSFIFNPIIYYA